MSAAEGRFGGRMRLDLTELDCLPARLSKPKSMSNKGLEVTGGSAGNGEFGGGVGAGLLAALAARLRGAMS